MIVLCLLFANDFLYAVYNGVRLNMELLDIVDENGIPKEKPLRERLHIVRE